MGCRRSLFTSDKPISHRLLKGLTCKEEPKLRTLAASDRYIRSKVFSPVVVLSLLISMVISKLFLLKNLFDLFLPLW
jgi:hypothetical protein